MPALALVCLLAALQWGPTLPERPAERDSLAFEGQRTSWIYEVYPEGEGWVRVTDPGGGQALIPSVLTMALAERVRAFLVSDGRNVVIYTPRPVFVAGVGVVSLAVFALVWFPLSRYRLRLAQTQERLRLLTANRRRIADSREAERLFVAQEIHDGPIQNLHALRMQLSIAARGGVVASKLPPPDPLQDLQQVIKELRAISENLRPPALGPFGLAAALRAFSARFADLHADVVVEDALEDDGERLTERERLALFRIAQEAMNNAVKHGAPSTIALSLRFEGDLTILEICDDGVGFVQAEDVGAYAADGHYGLLGMEERAYAIGALLAVASDPGGDGPTCVRVRFRPRPTSDPQDP
ncbi:sensor histidine kinase [Rubrivirga sp. IMCC45206]|uniref:sensor histidine kinase n=1 Tax=Rubrivirga sp. IMCC45206 TaxID=3391614 RepID=UPI003990032E